MYTDYFHAYNTHSVDVDRESKKPYVKEIKSYGLTDADFNIPLYNMSVRQLQNILFQAQAEAECEAWGY